MRTGRRSVGGRIGIVALNLIAPGLGLLRVDDRRGAIACLAGVALALLAVATASALAPAPGFAAFVLIAGGITAAILGALLYSTIQSWRLSTERQPLAPWSRWYGIVAAAMRSIAASNVAFEIYRSNYRLFYMPSVSMEPTLQIDDRMFGDMRPGPPPRRGDLILFRMADGITYVKRVAAVPGDRVAMASGVPVIDGVEAATVPVGATIVEGRRARVLQEMLPGERGAHRVIDSGRSPLDEMAERVVPPGQYFVLGDNRDNSSDSRLSREEYGTGLVSAQDIQGRLLFIYWSATRDRAGTVLR